MPRVFFYEHSSTGPARGLRCEDLTGVFAAWRPEDVVPVLVEVQRAVDRGLYAAGFLSYEAASGLDEALVTHPAAGLPLVWFGLFRSMNRCDVPAPVADQDLSDRFTVGDWQASLGEAEYAAAIDHIRAYIASGDTYQVNYTMRLRAAFHGDPWPLCLRLWRAQAASYGAYVDTGKTVICSASPELFFSLDGPSIVTRPMKGTASRAPIAADDARQRLELAASPKDRAENTMIVDMMRNDLGRIARRGSVEVLSAFDVEKYPTLYQMTSTVAAQTAAPFVEIMRALFPAASITGAPKVRTMQIIRELESGPRGVYTGAIGYWAPQRQARFNVAIRTVAINPGPLDPAAGSAEYGVGGGIVWDSTAPSEYAECRTKAAMLTIDRPPFRLLETLLYDAQQGYFLLERHLERLRASADYFDFALDPAAIARELAEFGSRLSPGSHRVRLLVDAGGNFELESWPLLVVTRPAPWRLCLAHEPVDPKNVALYHKTTWRTVYDTAYSQRGDADDVVLWNTAGDVTETTIANLVIEKEGRRITPPLSCGLLAGVFRGHLLATGQIEEGRITLADLRAAQRIFAVNSVRQWMPAVLV